LNALYTLLESKKESKQIPLSADQLNEILLSKKEIETGIFTEHYILDKEFEKWQKEK
jgi:hypothetical protein